MIQCCPEPDGYLTSHREHGALLKIVLFGHKPPPYHGQSMMVKQILDNIHDGIQWYHVDSRLSHSLNDVGKGRLSKAIRLIGFCLQAVWYRVRFGADTLFYQPSPGALTPLIRDWLAMLICGPFFRQRIYVWTAAGLGEWLETSARPWQRWLTYRLLAGPDLSIVKSEFGRRDARQLRSRHIRVVFNGIPDPCPDFSKTILPARQARIRHLNSLSQPVTGSHEKITLFNVLYLSLCTPEKGLFDTIDGVILANEELANEGSPIRIRLTVAGEFVRRSDRLRFELLRDNPALSVNIPSRAPKDPQRDNLISYVGFVTGNSKRELYENSDCFCFPTYYQAESFGTVIIEAMAYNLPIISTYWRMVPEIFPENYQYLVNARNPNSIAHILKQLVRQPEDIHLRDWFLNNYTLKIWQDRMHSALSSVSSNTPDGEREGDLS